MSAASRWSPVQAGNIYQEFSSVEEGKVTNIIEFDFLPFLEQGQFSQVIGLLSHLQYLLSMKVHS